jgi:hypothetical protein
VLLIEPDDLELVVAHDRDVGRVGDRLVAGVHDHPAALPADDARLDGEGVLEARRHVVVVVVHDHVGSGLDLGDPGESRGPPEGGDPAGGPDPAVNPVRLQQVGDAGEEGHRLTLPLVPERVVDRERAMALVAGDPLEAQPGKVHHLPRQGQGLFRGVGAAPVHPGVDLDHDPKR